MKFSEVITIDRSDAHVKVHGQGQGRTVAQVKTNFALIWAFPARNSSYSYEMMPKVWTEVAYGRRRGALLFLKVTRHISRSYGTKKSSILTKIECVWTVTQVWIHWWLRNDAQSLNFNDKVA